MKLGEIHCHLALSPMTPPYFSCFPFHSLSLAAIAISPPSYHVLCHLVSPSVPPVPIYRLCPSQISSR